MKSLRACCFPSSVDSIQIIDSEKGKDSLVNNKDNIKEDQIDTKSNDKIGSDIILDEQLEREKTQDVSSNHFESKNDNSTDQTHNEGINNNNQRRLSSISNFTFFPNSNDLNMNDENNNSNNMSSSYHLSHEIINDSSLSFSSSKMLLYPSNQQINQSIIQSAPIIELKETEGNMFKGKSIIIEANGCINSLRQANDGFTFFGSNMTNDKGEIVNDVVIVNKKNNNKDNDDSKGNNNDHYFIIYYQANKGKYYFKGVQKTIKQLSSLIFIRLNRQCQVYHKLILLCFDKMFQLTLNDTRNNELTIQILSSKSSMNTNEYRKVFLPTNGNITIGRDKNCSISFENVKSISKVHCTIYYSIKEKCWIITDGGLKPSINGCWIMSNHSYPIDNNFEFKMIGGSRFKINIKDTNNYNE